MAAGNRTSLQPASVGALVTLTVVLAFWPAAADGQLTFDFDTTGPTTTADLPGFFDLFGFDAIIGSDLGWRIEPNAVNVADSSKALYTASNGNQLQPWFSRVAILKAEVFEAENVEISCDITWADNDNAGLYARFNGGSGVPLENDYYHVRIAIDNGPPSSVNLHRVKDGQHTLLATAVDAPFPVSDGDTVRLTFRAVANELFVWANGAPVPGMNPFVDDDPLLGSGRVGVGQETNPSYFDNLMLLSLDSSGFARDSLALAVVDPPLSLGLRVTEDCARPVSYTIVPTPPGVVSLAGPLLFGPGDEFQLARLTVEGPGSTVLNTTNDRGCDDYTLTLTVHDFQSVDLVLLQDHMTVGSTQQAAVIGDFGPAGRRDLTGQATFSVDPPTGVISVSPDGLLTAVGVGTAEITATVAAISRGATVVVADVLRQSDPGAPHRDGILDYTPFRSVGHARGDPETDVRRWGDVWGYEYDGTNPNFVGKVYAYVGVDSIGRGIVVFDMTDPTQPIVAGSYAPSGEGGLQLRDVEVYDGIGYFSSNDGGGVHIVDVRANPIDPPLLKRVTSADGGTNGVHRLNVDVTDNGTFLYEAGSGNGVAVFDVTSPRNPSSIVKLAHMNDSAHDALAKDGRLYISRGSTLTMYDVTDIKNGNAMLLTRFNSGSGTHSSYPSENDEYLYVGHEGGTRDLRVYDLRDLDNVREVGSSRMTNDELNAGSLSNVHNQFVFGDFLFNAWSEAGLTVHDITDPRRPVLVGTFDTDSTHTDSSFEGAFGVYPGLGLDRILVADRGSGLWIVDGSPPPDPQGPMFKRGDSDARGSVNITDGIRVLSNLFLGEPELTCADAADANDDGELDLSDAVFAFIFLFLGGPSPPAPGAFDCGADPTDDVLDCAAYDSCEG